MLGASLTAAAVCQPVNYWPENDKSLCRCCHELCLSVCLSQVVKYWPESGKSGFIVWRYMLCRDDPSPAPWTKAGKRRIEELGLTLQVHIASSLVT